MINVPTPSSSNEIKAFFRVVDGQVTFDFDGLDKTDVVIRQFWGNGTNGVPVLEEIDSDAGECV